MLTSYAQNFEDVMLWRALSHVEQGFYIDIGAQHPIIDSVSLMFHEHGWRGIHIEPTPYYAELLRQQRPGDTIIQAAIGNGSAVLNFFEISDTGISTADPVIAQQHRERGFDVHKITVPCIKLSAVFKSCIEPEIHWLKIDVEGFEKQVLTSWGKSTIRPWIVIVESTLPLTQIETHKTWQPILIRYGYTPVYFDGLNRYYISDAHPELKQAFLAPPNVFDNFALNGTASATFCHLIDARYKQKINETLTLNEQQKLFADNEIERLTLNLAELGKTQVEREHYWIQHEQEKDEQDRQHIEQEHALQRDHAEHEKDLTQQLQNGQQELLNLERERMKREQLLSEQSSQIRQELENLLRTLVQREQEVGAQLLSIQQQAAEEKAEQARSHGEQEHTLHRQHAEREQDIARQLRAAQQELRILEQNWAQHQTELNKEIADLQIEAQALNHAQQLQALHHDAELKIKLDEHNRLIESYAALEVQLKAEILLEQQTSLRLHETLAHIQQSLATTHASLTWRMTAPLRNLSLIITPKKNRPASPKVSETESPHIILPFNTASQSSNVQDSSIETIMYNSAQAINQPAPAIASSLDELLSYHNQQFVHCAYHTLLGRDPDTEGLGYYLGRLRTGFSKMQLVAQLRSSKEGKAHAKEIKALAKTEKKQIATLPGLDKAIKRYKRGQYILIGWLFRWLYGSESNHPTLRKLRAIENQLFLLGDESNHRFSQMETALADLHHLIGQQTEAVVAALGSMPLAPQAQSVVTAMDNKPVVTPDPPPPPTQPPVPDGLKQLSPRGRDIYFQLKSAAAIYGQRIA